LIESLTAIASGYIVGAAIADFLISRLEVVKFTGIISASYVLFQDVAHVIK